MLMANDSWATPQYIFDWLDEEFHFGLDAACTFSNCKCERGLFYPDYDALTEDWSKDNELNETYRNVWLNPPYSNPLPWVKKAYEEGTEGTTVVCLLPADTSTKWFHDWVYGKAEIRFIKGRVRFVDPTTGKVTKDPPKFGSMIVIYGPNAKVGQVFTVDRPDIKVKHIS
jgi:phage N-6-adenine-methyltransferase